MIGFPDSEANPTGIWILYAVTIIFIFYNITLSDIFFGHKFGSARDKDLAPDIALILRFEYNFYTICSYKIEKDIKKGYLALQ